jgi:Tol biopolymer transport system component
MSRVLLLGLAAAVVTSVVAGAGEAAAPIPAGLVVYEHQLVHGGRVDGWLEVRDLAGRSRRVLTPRLRPGETRIDFAATWSPDGATVGFVRETRTQDALYLVDADGSNLRRVVTLASVRPLAGNGNEPSGISGADWSTDASKLLFTAGGVRSAACASTGVFRVAVDGSDLHPLWRRPRRLSATVGANGWSPDGSHALFTIDRNLGDCLDHSLISSELDLISDAGADRRQVATEGDIRDVAWSPDGEAIAYSVDCLDVCNLALAFTNGRRARRLTHFREQVYGGGLGADLPFSWSGRGRELILSHPVGSGDSLSLYSMDATTGVARKLVTAPCPAKRSCAFSEIWLYGISSTARVAVFDVVRDIRGSGPTQRYAAYIDEGRLVRLPLPSLGVDDVYLP